MFPENTLTAPEEVLQMILCKCGTDKPCSRKIGSCPKAVIMGTCATIREQYSMKTVIVEMTMLPKRLMTMALQKNNKDEFVYVIL